MNLTSKRMLQFALLCAGACAFSASAAATQFVADSFENDAGHLYPATNGLGVVYYKASGDNGFGVPTATNWLTAAGDASKIVTADALNQGFATVTRPMAGAVSNLVLNLETEGQTLTRVADAPHNFFTGDPVYVDTLIKFTASEDNPVIDDINVKAAVFVNNSLNLVVFHNTESSGKLMTDTGVPVNTNDWYRLTILLGNPAALGTTAFQVLLNGSAVVSAQGYDDTGAQPGSWFLNASADNTLNAVAFQGTGLVDELVIADEVSYSSTPPSILLTLDFDATKVNVTAGGSPVADLGTVASGTEIVIDAADFYEIASVTGAGTGVYAGSPVPGALVNVSTGTVTATAIDTMTITAQPFSAATGIGTGLGGGNLPANKVAAWAIANSQTESSLTSAMLDDYLCNVAPGTNPTLVITDMVIDNDAGTATITVGSTGDTVDFDTINGTLVVYTADTIAGLSEATAGVDYDVTVQLNQTATIVVNLAGNNFIRAVIK